MRGRKQRWSTGFFVQFALLLGLCMHVSLPVRAQEFDPPPPPSELPPTLAGEIHLGLVSPIRAGKLCPAHADCIFNGGGGIGGDLEWRYSRGLGIGVGYEGFFLDGNGVYELTVIQILRAILRYRMLLQSLAHPYVGVGAGVAIFGDKFHYAALGGSVASIIVRKIGPEERPVVLLLYPMLANFILMAAALPFVYEPMPIEHMGFVGIMSVLGWIGGVVIIKAYNAGEAVIVAPMQYSQILWATAYGMVFFNETPDGRTVLGAGIIIASGLYIVLRESRKSESNRPVLQSKNRPDTGTSPRRNLIDRVTRSVRHLD